MTDRENGASDPDRDGDADANRGGDAAHDVETGSDGGAANAADDATEERGQPRRSSPFSDLADRLRERRTTEADASPVDEAADDPFADLDVPEPDVTGTDPFEAMDVGDIHAEDVWEALEAEAETTVQPGVGADDAERVERADPTADRPDHVVPKSSYCQRCEHFTAPPEVACTHEGTEIVAVVDADHFRVRNCPVVQEEPFDGPDAE